MNREQTDRVFRLLNLAVFNPSAEESSSALGVVKTMLNSANLDVNGLFRSYSSNQNMLIELLSTKLDRIEAENNFFRSAYPDQVRSSEKAGLIQSNWREFDELVYQKNPNFDPTSSEWRNKVARSLNVSARTLHRWWQGLERVPEDVIDRLSSLDINVAATRPSASHTDENNNQPTENTQLTENAQRRKELRTLISDIVSRYLAGEGKTEIAEKCRVDLNKVTTHTNNTQPPYWLNIQVQTSGTTTWPELWLIGSTLFKKNRGWIGPTKELLGIKDAGTGLSYDPNTVLDVRQLAVLRQRFHRVPPDERPPQFEDHSPYYLSQSAARMVEAIKRAGPEGETFMGTGLAKGHQRLKDLTALGILRVASKNGLKRYVHNDWN